MLRGFYSSQAESAKPKLAGYGCVALVRLHSQDFNRKFMCREQDGDDCRPVCFMFDVEIVTNFNHHHQKLNIDDRLASVDRFLTIYLLHLPAYIATVTGPVGGLSSRWLAFL